MSELLALLQFMWMPFLVALLFSSTLPIVGTALAVRTELMVAVALPMLSGCILALLAALGLPEHFVLLRIGLTVPLVALLYWLVMKLVTAPSVRQLMLAVLWVGSEAITRLLVAANPAMDGTFSQLLAGEILAIGAVELIATALLSLVAVALLFGGYRPLRSYLLDPMELRRFPALFARTDLLFKVVVTALVVLGTVTLGPLVTTALMIFPALGADNGRSGLLTALRWAALLGATAVVLFFPVALLVDLPPAYVVAAGLLLLCGGTKLIRTLFCK